MKTPLNPQACECSCEHGFLRKDLDWNPPWPLGQGGAIGGAPLVGEEANGARRKRKKSQKCHSKITIGLPTFSAMGIHENAQVTLLPIFKQVFVKRLRNSAIFYGLRNTEFYHSVMAIILDRLSGIKMLYLLRKNLAFKS